MAAGTENDPKDAQVILHMLKIGAAQAFHDPLRAGINDIQELSKTHEAISRAKTRSSIASSPTICRFTFPKWIVQGQQPQRVVLCLP